MESLHPASQSPKDFDPLNASNPELVKYGLPPRPPQGSDQLLQDRWLHNMSLPLHYVYPDFHLKTERIERMSAAIPDSRTTTTSRDWCGAILRPSEGQKFLAECANWTVPNVYPPESARTGESTWKDGIYYCRVTAGLEGGGDNMCGLIVGTISEVEVSGGKIVRQDAYVHARYPPRGPDLKVTNFNVKPGDFICARAHIDPVDHTKGFAIFLNETAVQYTSFRYDLSGGAQFGGGPVRWGIENTGNLVDYKYDAFARFGEIYIVEPVAVRRIENVMRGSDLSDAEIVNMVHDHKDTCSVSKVTPYLLKIH